MANLPPIIPSDQQAANARATVAHGIVLIDNEIQGVDANILAQILAVLRQCETESGQALGILHNHAVAALNHTEVRFNQGVIEIQDCIINGIGNAIVEANVAIGNNIGSFKLGASFVTEVTNAYRDSLEIGGDYRTKKYTPDANLSKDLSSEIDSSQSTVDYQSDDTLPPIQNPENPSNVPPVTVTEVVEPLTTGGSLPSVNSTLPTGAVITVHYSGIIAGDGKTIPSIPVSLFWDQSSCNWSGGTKTSLAPYVHGFILQYNSSVGSWTLQTSGGHYTSQTLNAPGKTDFSVPELFQSEVVLVDTTNATLTVEITGATADDLAAFAKYCGKPPATEPPVLPPYEPPLPPTLPPTYDPPKPEPPSTKDKCCPPTVINVAPCPPAKETDDDSVQSDKKCHIEYDFNNPLLFFLSECNDEIRLKLSGFLGDYGSRLASATNIYDLLNPIDPKIFDETLSLDNPVILE